MKDGTIAVSVGENCYVYGSDEATARLQDLLQRLVVAEGLLYKDRPGGFVEIPAGMLQAQRARADAAEARIARLEEALRSIKHLPRYEGQVALHELIDAALDGRDE